jgi:hypothetical protein
MVSRDDAWKRRREREDEEDEKASSNSKGTSLSVAHEKFDELITRAEPIIEQLNHLYQMFVLGTEKLPPLERRKQLDQLMTSLQMMPKSTPAAQFRYSSLQAQYTTYKERWEKMMKDLEAGKLKRIVGLKKDSKQ